MGAVGRPNVRTRNLDRMVREGTLCRNGFASGPVGVPSRKSCFSGLHPHGHGSPTNRGDKLPWQGSMLDQFARRTWRGCDLPLGTTLAIRSCQNRQIPPPYPNT